MLVALPARPFWIFQRHFLLIHFVSKFHWNEYALKKHPYMANDITSPAFTGVKIKSDGKPFSRACCATAEGITFLPLSLLEGG